RASALYDKRCSACHASVRHRTAVTAHACVECHMPQVPTNAGLTFTNHWIGIYRKDNLLVPVRRPGKTLPPVTVASLHGRLTPPGDLSSFRPLFDHALAESSGESKVARAATDLGLFLKSIGEFQAALPPLQKALEIDGSNRDPALAADQENLASVF